MKVDIYDSLLSPSPSAYCSEFRRDGICYDGDYDANLKINARSGSKPLLRILATPPLDLIRSPLSKLQMRSVGFVTFTTRILPTLPTCLRTQRFVRILGEGHSTSLEAQLFTQPVYDLPASPVLSPLFSRTPTEISFETGSERTESTPATSVCDFPGSNLQTKALTPGPTLSHREKEKLCRQRKHNLRSLSVTVPNDIAVPGVVVRRDHPLKLASYPPGLGQFVVAQSDFLNTKGSCVVAPPFTEMQRHQQPQPQWAGQTSTSTNRVYGSVTADLASSSESPDDILQDFLSLSAYLSSSEILDMAPEIHHLDIAMPRRRLVSWKIDQPDYWIYKDSLRFTNLTSFKWDGPLPSMGLPAPFFDFNALPLYHMEYISLTACTFALSDLKWLLDACSSLKELIIGDIVADFPSAKGTSDNSCPSAQLECHQLRKLDLSTHADLGGIVCLLDAPALSEVIYRPKKGYSSVYPITADNFPWNIFNSALEKLVISCEDGLEEGVYQELMAVAEEDKVFIEVHLEQHD